MTGDHLPLTFETTLIQLDAFCKAAENQLRPLMAQLEEGCAAYEGRSERLNALLDRVQGKGFKVMADVMELRARVRGLHNQFLEEIAST